MSGLSYALAVLIGAAEVALLLWCLSAMWRRTQRRRHRPTVPSQYTAAASSWRRSPRHPAGTACEEVIVRQRLTGQIDAATYQARMAGLVRGAR